jgi:NAD(P)-dependent dehydrogenase (short-subunit alcohol dehydrogenase family)
MDLKDKVVVVTGGSRGIGAATARLAAAEGYRVAINYRADQAAAEAVVADIQASGGEARAFQADVGREADIVRLFAEVIGAFGSLAGLVNNAGIHGGDAEVTDFNAAALTELMAVNVVGTMLCCREAVRRMSTRHGGAGGAIVNVSSMAATIGGRPGRSHYAASKAAVDSFTMGFAKEVATDGIRVNAVRPGMTYSDMTGHLRGNDAARAAASATIA